MAAQSTHESNRHSLQSPKMSACRYTPVTGNEAAGYVDLVAFGSAFSFRLPALSIPVKGLSCRRAWIKQ